MSDFPGQTKIRNEITINEKDPSAQHATGKRWAMLMGLTFFLSVPAMPIGMGLTTSRVAIVLLFFLALFKISRNNGRIPFTTLIPISAASVAFLAYTISMIVNGGSWWFLFSWLPLGLLSSLIAICIADLGRQNTKFFVGTIAFLSILLCVLIMIVIARNGVLFSSGRLMRHFLNDQMPVGLNRFINSFVIYAGISMGALYFRIAKGKLWSTVFIVPVLFSIYLSFSGGSRQNFLALIVFLLFFILITVNIRRASSWFSSYIRRIIIIVFICIAGVLGAIHLGWLEQDWIARRFFPLLIEGEMSSSDQTRLNIASVAIEASLNRGGLGIGPGQFVESVGNYPHNGYFGFLAESGLLFGGPALIFIFAMVLVSWVKRKQLHHPLNEIAWVVFLTVALFMVNLNDLFKEPAFWTTLGLAIGLSARAKLPPYR